MDTGTTKFLIVLCAFNLVLGSAVNAADPVRSLQTFLNGRQCHAGAADGAWGQKTENAARLFTQASNIEIARPITESLLEELEGTSVTCPLILPKNPIRAEQFRLESEHSVRAPLKLDGGIERFWLLPGECKAGPKAKTIQAIGLTNDCSRNRQRSEMKTTKKVRHGARRIYSWDILVPTDFRSTASDDHLIVGQFHSGFAPSSTFSLSQDTGYFVNGRTCFGPEEFGEWHSVVVRVFWHSQRKKNLKDKTPSVFEVWCDGELIWDRSGRPNIAKGDGVSFKYGLYHAMDFPEGDNVTVQFKNVTVTKW
ncbi:Polysacc lyase domain containing protein [Sulfitobacter noctilucicola]|uniref:Polysaccharide lyase n=1 Tax=Sulfitobacter noctilucicola TaxID=1342301 RepID=A0A7W6MC76_9RHOB|nr:heparin lyase I family protein [Sulfitobacter noctilucicola]KIN69836.1 Polysacc lyase domain containing protein [Sulfitobacter noctilucicola]MBB4176206.1 hypothetical protein [Sulfitobacter noctilucicola]